MAGAKVGQELWADSLGPTGSSGATYIDSFEFNTRALRLCDRAGFQRRSRFDGPDRAFWILTRDLMP